MPELCDACFTGVRHEGTPEGTFEKIGGVNCYVATPSGDYPKDKVVLFLTDVFGIILINNQLLVDDFARNGYKTIAPDILNDDARTDMGDPKFDRKAWMERHGPESWKPPLDNVIEALKASGVTRIGTTGYCFGAPPALYIAMKNECHVTVLTHPSRLKVPDVFVDYKFVCKAPLLLNSCEIDPAFPAEDQTAADEILGDGKFAPGYLRTYWEGATHGYAVRGDMSNPKVKAGKEGTFEATVKFYYKYL